MSDESCPRHPDAEASVSAAEALAAARSLPRSEAGLGALVKALRPRLVAVALRLVRDPDVADDVVQSAFEKALRHGESFRGEARVSTWMHRIVTNESLMWLRGQKRRARRMACLSEAGPEALADPQPDAAHDLSAHEAARRLREGIAALGANDRDVIEGCLLAERSYGEYGAERGLHPAAVKTRVFRARRRLHAWLVEREA